MITTDAYDIPCLGAEDFAGIPIYMQELGTRIENALFEQQTALERFLDTGSIIWTRTAPLVIAFDVRTTVPFPTVAGGAGFTPGARPALPAVRGWFYVGASWNMTPVGATTLNTLRQLNIEVTTTGIEAPDHQDLAFFRDLTVTTNSTGGDNMWAGGTVYSDGLGVYPIDIQAYHDNVASGQTITLTPAPLLYMYYLGDTPDIRQVP